MVIDTYSRYPEVQLVKSTEFSELAKALAPVWATHGIPEMVRHDGGPPYNGWKWRQYARQEGFKTDKTTPCHPQANGLVEKFNRSIVKMIHGAIAEKKDPKTEVQKFLINYRNTPHDTTGKCPSQLLMNRTIRTKVPVLIPCPTGKAHEEARQADRKQKEKQKNYADKQRRARVVEYEVGDKVLLKQTKTTVKPPYDPEPYVVEQVEWPEVTASRGMKVVTRNVQRWKRVKERPKYLQERGIETATQDVCEDEDDDDWFFELRVQPPARQEQERQAAAGEQPAQQGQLPQEGPPVQLEQDRQAAAGEQPPQQRQIPQERWEVAHGPWRPKVNNPSPRERKRRKQQARNRDKGQGDHHYGLRSKDKEEKGAK